ncbi:hypothetical protein [Paenibacillus xylanexedens]|uniref:hypothetical protein n=1 Tax=Paenibacillus xylanexedens TaxID=528191 RepID=UPI0011A6E467|nr:hypothetical protein [Paenibacillus xylanexedens]
MGEEVKIGKSRLQEWMGKYGEVKDEGVGRVDGVKEVEGEVKEMGWLVEEKEDRVGDREEEVGIVKKGVEMLRKRKR